VGFEDLISMMVDADLAREQATLPVRVAHAIPAAA
jgi:hypothetical protein